ncbi:MAG: hypothetical protein GC146_10670 [Limimaricola sp.]|uniref:hypothetical protein n=1 Tax=Limimaricola sp. TaxID=2211665 RepID=UPI001E084754|nr:hypothetical protein [Limimaricola sp.]MBI1417673.1 hypothetical protein [Limimaricola sp.]
MKKALASIVFCAIAGAAQAGPMTDVVNLCTDPMTTGPEKVARLPDMGWAPIEADPTGPLADLSTALIIGFTNGMPDLESRFAAAPRLAGNFATMTTQGQASVWSQGDAVLAITIAQTDAGGEHLGCYFANLPSDELMDWMSKYGGPETLPALELIALRYDETAMRFSPDITYKMYSTWTRLTSDPARTRLTDGFRMERVQMEPS